MKIPIWLAFGASLHAAFVNAKNYHFDGLATSSGNGSKRRPYNTLDTIQDLDLRSGDTISLKRGTTFNQALEIHAAGAPGNPIVVQSYGDKALALPVVAGVPSRLSAVLLNGTSHITVQDLEITHSGDNSTALRGVYVYAEDAGEVQDIVIRRLFIHDVYGYMPSTAPGGLPVGKYSNASGGIVIEAAGNKVPTYFTNILVEDNKIDSVGREGIYTWSNWCRREALAAFWYELCFQPWHATTGLQVRNNRLSNIAGDGIVITGSVDALTTGNHVSVFNKGSGGNNAGIWTANSDGSLFQYNVVSQGSTTHDGMAYDVDHSTSGTVFEYNVSHDNEGGFFLICPYDKPTKNFTIRYNLSVNDRARMFQLCAGDLANGKIYKNTMYIGDGLTPAMVYAPSENSFDVLFADNIAEKDGAGSVRWVLSSPEFNVTDNILNGAIDSYESATRTVTDRPELLAPGLRDPYAYLLGPNSPAVDTAISIVDDSEKDFFSNPTIQHNNLGFYAGSPAGPLQWFDKFDSIANSNWEQSGPLSIVSDPAGDLGNSLGLGPQASLSRAFCSSSTGLRFDLRLWFNAIDAPAKKAPSVIFDQRVIKLHGFSNSKSNDWQIMEVVLDPTGAISATLDGVALEVSGRKKHLRSDTVQIMSGDSTMLIDDALLLSL